MPWISVSSERSRLKESAAHKIDREREGKVRRTYSQLPTIGAFISGEKELISGAVRRCMELLPKTRAEQEPAAPEFVENVVSMAIAGAYEGFDPSRVFELIADGAGYTEGAAALQRIVRQILRRANATIAGKSAKPATEKEWIDVVFDGPADQALDLALTPDHPRWGTMSMFALPLAYLLSKDAKSWRERFLSLLQFGPFAPSANEIVYENQVLSDDLDVKSEDGRTRWHVGFDSVRVRGAELLVYHYVGASATAADAMKVIPDVLAHRTKGWSRLEGAVDAKTWKRVSKAIDDATHTIVYREGRKPIPKRWLQEAAEKYALRLVANDVTGLDDV